MATIEPRLIHLLNNSQTPDLPSLNINRLPPLNSAASNQSLSLPPIDPDNVSSAQAQIPPIYTVNDEVPLAPGHRLENGFPNDSAGRLTGSGRPLQLLLGEPERNTSTLPLRMLVGGTPETSDDLSTKKRHRALTTKDDFVQLPQPLKKQKSSQQVVSVPPIINGLHEPPPNAAVFPPITARHFDEREVLGPATLNEFSSSTDDRTGTAPTSDGDRSNGGTKVKRRAAKPRRKWSEEETNHLLLGVSKHGVGKWTSILEDPDFKFNDRTAGDLKDRFRTCCPDELRAQSGKRRQEKDSGDQAQPRQDDKWKPKGGLDLENILTEPERSVERDQDGTDSGPKQKKSRAHRKKLEDLVELGIRGPFKKSHRRERRPFTEQDDKEILEGLAHYGPAWTKIQRDSKYNLSSRQPTDLRDRVRNKYPEIYARIEKGSFQVKEHLPVPRGIGSNSLLEPSVSTNLTNSFNSATPTSSAPALEPALTRSSSKDDMSRWVYGPAPWETTESPRPLPDPFDTNENTGPFLGGTAPEMDIARLLLDDPHGSGSLAAEQHHMRHLTYNGHNGYDGFPISRESPPGSGSHPPSYTHMLNR